MTNPLESLKGISDKNQAVEILEGISDFDILGGEYSGDDLKKKVRSLLKIYHPDIPDEDLTMDVKTAITKRLNSIGEKSNIKKQATDNTRPYGTRRSRPSYEERTGNHQQKNKYSSTHTNYTKTPQSIAEDIFHKFNNSAKYNHNFENNINELLKIEEEYKISLTKEKNQIIKLKVQDLYDKFDNSEKYDHLFDNSMKYLIKIENDYGSDLSKTKKQIIRLKVKDLYDKFNNSPKYDHLFNKSMEYLIKIENDHGCDLTFEKERLKE